MLEPPMKPIDARKQRARANRRRMVEAAIKLFSERGYGVPLTAIATEAGVAVQTLYFTFHTKSALLTEALQLAVLGDDQPIPPHEREWFHRMVAEPDARRGVGIVVDNTAAIFVRVAPLVGVLRTGEPEVAALWKHSERLRHEGYRKMVEALAAKANFREGLDADAATDVLFTLLSPDLFQLIVTDCGWDLSPWREWITGLLFEALFG
jgi:AcrR family transcriptional regulator